MTRSRVPRTRTPRDVFLCDPPRKTPPPDPNAWIALLCERCTRFFRTQGIKRHCVRCISEAAKRGVVGSEYIGEASGS